MKHKEGIEKKCNMRECVFIKGLADFKCVVAKNMVLYYPFIKLLNILVILIKDL